MYTAWHNFFFTRKKVELRSKIKEFSSKHIISEEENTNSSKKNISLKNAILFGQ
jgi:hypothetical protein